MLWHFSRPLLVIWIGVTHCTTASLTSWLILGLRLQSVQNAAARLITGTRQCERQHQSQPVFRQLHCHCVSYIQSSRLFIGVGPATSRATWLTTRYRRRRLTIAFCRHSNTGLRSHTVQFFWRRGSTSALEQFAVCVQFHWHCQFGSLCGHLKHWSWTVGSWRSAICALQPLSYLPGRPTLPSLSSISSLLRSPPFSSLPLSFPSPPLRSRTPKSS